MTTATTLVELAAIVTGVCAALVTEGRTEPESVITISIVNEHAVGAWPYHMIGAMVSAEGGRLGVLA